MRCVQIVLALLTLILLPIGPTAHAGRGGGGHSGATGRASSGGHHPGVKPTGGHGGGRLPSVSGGNGIPWDQPVLHPDQLPEARLARFVQHVFHPHGM